jgi:two-component system, NtrC family, response regulator AtoC
MPEPQNTSRGSDAIERQSAPESTPLRVAVRDAARQVESRIIMETLERNRWNRRRTAEALQISYRSLMYKMKSARLRGDRTRPVSE